MPRRSHLDPPIIPFQVVDAYVEGESIENLARLNRCGTRMIRQILVDGGVTIRGTHEYTASDLGLKRQPGGRHLSVAEIQRLRRAIGFDPSWVDRPEYLYDREHDEKQRQTPPDRMAHVQMATAGTRP